MILRVVQWLRGLSPLDLFAIALILRVGFVFGYSDWSMYLTGDMDYFWHRALQAYRGDWSNPEQFGIWPPAYHQLLALGFHVLTWLGVDPGRWLGVVLFCQCVLGAASVAWFFQIAQKLSGRVLGAICGLGYACAFMPLYFSAFIISDALAVPVLLLALWFVVVHYRLDLAGFALGLAVAVRPSFGVFAVPLFGYLWAVNRSRSWVLLPGLVFVLASFTACDFLLSRGMVVSASPNGGVNFLMGQLHTSRIVTNFRTPGMRWTFSICRSDNSRAGMPVVSTTVPFWQQGYYFRRGLAQLRYARTWEWDLHHINNLYWGALYPNAPCHWLLTYDGFSEVLTGVLALIAFCSVPWRWLRSLRVPALAWLLWGLVICIDLEAMGGPDGERRYVIGILWCYLALASWAILPVEKVVNEKSACRRSRLLDRVSFRLTAVLAGDGSSKPGGDGRGLHGALQFRTDRLGRVLRLFPAVRRRGH